MRRGRDALSGQGADVPLEVQIEKKLSAFSLDVSFNAADEPLSVLGPSGAGKTMLLRCIAGLEQPDRGRIALANRVLYDSEQRASLPARQRRVGMLFQNYALFPHRTVEENVAFGLETMPSAEIKTRVATLVERTHLKGLEQRYPRELSGGERQRAALARALAIDPDALLLDEPLSALDTHLRSQMETELLLTFSAYRRPALLVTHNIEEAYRMSSRMLVLSRGRVVATGAKEEILRHPPTVEVARLTGCKNFSRAKAISENVVEAIDWGCRLRAAQPIAKSPAFVGIRAHRIDFVEPSAANTAGDNVFPCWLVRSSETPFRITLYLRLHQQSGGLSEFHLQAEMFKEKWAHFRGLPQPLHVRLSPDALMLLQE
jgi:ABC-type sulfate/molybdate transport systems ATPase subunit